MLEPLSPVVAIVVLSLSLYLGYQFYRRRFYSMKNSAWFAILAFLFFAIMVLSQSMMLLSADYSKAELLARFAFTSALVSGFFAVKSFSNGDNDKKIFPDGKKKISFHKLTYIVYSAVVIGLIWTTTPFKIELTIDFLGGMSHFAIPNLWFLLILYCGMALLAINVLRYNSNLLFPTTASNKEKFAGILCASIAVSAFLFGAVLPYASINLVSLGHLTQIGILGGIVYLYRGPTVLETFFVFFDKRRTKESNEAKSANRTMLRVEPDSDYTRWINDFLHDGDPNTNILFTHESNKILKSRKFKERCKIICFSLSEESKVRKVDDILVVRLSEPVIIEVLEWVLKNMGKGKLVVDNLSHFALLVGLEFTYVMVTMISELSSRHGIDALFVTSNNTGDEKLENVMKKFVDEVLTERKGIIYSTIKS